MKKTLLFTIILFSFSLNIFATINSLETFITPLDDSKYIIDINLNIDISDNLIIISTYSIYNLNVNNKQHSYGLKGGYRWQGEQISFSLLGGIIQDLDMDETILSLASNFRTDFSDKVYFENNTEILYLPLPFIGIDIKQMLAYKITEELTIKGGMRFMLGPIFGIEASF
ncbi:hypothetical protein [Natronospora cellulosivora (SeqCode)]